MAERKTSLIFCILFCLLLAGLAAYDLKAFLAQEEDQARERVERTSFLIGEWIKGSFKITDYLLSDILGHVEKSDLVYPHPDAEAQKRLTKFIISKMNTVSNVILVGLFNQNCIITHVNNNEVGWDGSSRDYCFSLRDDANRQTFVIPVSSEISSQESSASR